MKSTLIASILILASLAYSADIVVYSVLPNQTLSASTTAVPAGVYAATDLATVDPDLAAANIVKDTNIFGVVGTYEGGGSAYPAMVAKTGMTNSYATGDDGDLELGIALPVPRFTIQANTNCVLDNLTGLVWARNAHLFSSATWGAAVTNCNNLDYGGQTDWRLPNNRELNSIVDYRFVSPALCNTAGTGQWSENDPFTGATLDQYWTSSTKPNNTLYAWYHGLISGQTYYQVKDGGGLYIWPVRGPD